MKECEVVVVDDDEITLSVITNALNTHSVKAFSSPIEAIDFVRSLDSPPFLIILDLKMPEMNGFEVCEIIRESLDEKITDIFFYTSSNDLEERLRGYEVGANDFLNKPIETKELQAKVRTVVKRGKRKKLALQAKTVHSDSYRNAISELAEQNNLIHFLRASVNCATVEALNTLIIQTMSDYMLKSTVCATYSLDTAELTHLETNCESVSALEKELLVRLKHSDRIITRGRRLFLNYPFFTQIVKNMPEDPAQAGRYRDYLAIILETAEARLRSIIQTKEINLLIDELGALQNHTEKSYNERMKSMAETLAALIDTVENKVFEYSLTEKQENELLTLFNRSTDSAFSIMDNTDSIEALDNIMERLKHLVALAGTNEESDCDTIGLEFF